MEDANLLWEGEVWKTPNASCVRAGPADLLEAADRVDADPAQQLGVAVDLAQPRPRRAAEAGLAPRRLAPRRLPRPHACRVSPARIAAAGARGRRGGDTASAALGRPRPGLARGDTVIVTENDSNGSKITV